jgi:hypothetical protein
MKEKMPVRAENHARTMGLTWLYDGSPIPDFWKGTNLNSQEWRESKSIIMKGAKQHDDLNRETERKLLRLMRSVFKKRVGRNEWLGG